MATGAGARNRRRVPILWRLGLLTLGALTVSFAAKSVQANPEWTAAASFVIPGVGQAINGDYLDGGVQFGAYAIMANQYEQLINSSDYILPTDRTDDHRNITINRTSFDADLYGTFLTDLTFYSSYGAYRDARQKIDNAGYSTPAPQETLAEAGYAPFQWEYLQRPTTWIPVLVALAGALSPPDSQSYVYRPIGGLTRQEMAYGFAAQYESVAIGEESFFRGVLNNGFSDAFGENWGLATSSLIFGLAHAGVGDQATPVEATAFGAYLGWLHQRNDYDIREGVAIHFWWDFLTGLALLQQRSSQTRNTPVQLGAVTFHF